MNEGDMNDILKSHFRDYKTQWSQIPFPAEICPRGGAPLAELDDTTLLTASPVMIAHIMRTAANGGIQVLSPRVIPLAEQVSRVVPDGRQSDLIVVGSTADENVEWPTFDGRSLAHLFDDDPFEPKGRETKVASALVTKSVAVGISRVKDPMVKAVVRAMGLVDMQRRSEVGGDPDGLSTIVETIWKMPPGTMRRTEKYGLAPRGDLLRYALGPDPGVPQFFMPVHTDKCVSVAVAGVERSDYGPHMSLDWAKCRVAAKAIYVTSMSIEGKGMGAMGRGEMPGDVMAPINRPNVLVFQPRYGAVFATPPRSFRVPSNADPGSLARMRTGPLTPATQAVVDSMVKWLGTLYVPVPQMALTSRTFMGIGSAPGDTLRTAAEVIFRALGAQALRGYNPDAVMRSALWRLIDLSPPEDVMVTAALSFWLAGHAAAIGRPPESVCEALVGPLRSLAASVRVAMSTEAFHKGKTLEGWYASLASQVPRRVREPLEGVAGWAAIIAWNVVTEPSVKWRTQAAGASQHAVHAMERRALTEGGEPAGLTGPPQVVYRVKALVERMAAVFASRYASMMNVERAVHASAIRVYLQPQVLVALRAFRLGALLWQVRSRIVASCSVKSYVAPIPDEDRREHVTYVDWSGGTFAISFNVQTPLAGLLGSLKAEEGMPQEVKDSVAGPGVALTMAVFRSPPVGYGFMGVPLAAYTEAQRRTRLMRYVVDPGYLLRDLRGFMAMVGGDIYELTRDRPRHVAVEGPTAMVEIAPVGAFNLGGLTRAREQEGESGWNFLAPEYLEDEAIENLMMRLEDALGEELGEFMETGAVDFESFMGRVSRVLNRGLEMTENPMRGYAADTLR